MYAIFDESSYTIAHKRVIADDDDFLLYASYQKYFLLFYFYKIHIKSFDVTESYHEKNISI